MTEEQLDALAMEDPETLINMLVDGSLNTSMLSFAAELAGREIEKVEFRDKLVSNLLSLLQHESSLVREGAVMGLDYLYYYFPNVQKELKQRMDPKVEPSEGVRDAAEEAVDFWTAMGVK